MKQIVLYQGDRLWLADVLAAGAKYWESAPTPFNATAPAQMVLAHIKARNPGAQVSIRRVI